MRAMREEFPRGRSVRGVRALDVLPPVPAVEVAGGSAGHAAHLQDVPGARQGRLRRGLRLSGQCHVPYGLRLLRDIRQVFGQFVMEIVLYR